VPGACARETPRTPLPLIERYVIELLDYFGHNRDKASSQED
jgi:hypothetical protein